MPRTPFPRTLEVHARGHGMGATMEERGRPRAGRVTRFLLWCGAVDTGHLASRTELYRYSMVGVFVLLVALMAGITFTLYASIIAGAFQPAFLAYAAVWALLIFCLDRSIVGEPSYGGSRRSGPARAVFFGARVVLAVIVAWLIGDALVLMIFRPEIAEETARVHERQAAEARQRAVARLEFRAAELRKQLAHNKDLRDAAARAAERARKRYVEEAKGISGTGLVGYGPAAGDARTDYLDARGELRRVRKATALQDAGYDRQSAALTRQAVALGRGGDKAVAAVPGLKKEIDAIYANNGWLTQLRGLSAFMDANRDPAIASLPWLVRGLFVTLDLMPLSMKALGRWTIYGSRQRAEFDRQMGRDRLRADLDRARDRLEFDTAMTRESWRHDWRMDHMRTAPQNTNGVRR
ncbi:DUF4407 domain-containing protein [Nonomuraea sp. LP-02]|uniref:DUF4407 domain-containing protein n=1 Tax=Nonomuraea sp. LP-02 TaxID=3097960 RepID=UPI002E355B3B|nr:DUF4407 domain-containing protein [Nonomuraea sp. LP-02]MED7931843.1 DUF4407 domain-containing protein [Nonomuraea sp. LP-02]